MPTNIPIPSTAAVDTQVLTVLHSALDGLARTLVTQVNTIIGPSLGRKDAREKIEQQVSAAMPGLLENIFIDGFLSDKKIPSQRRAMLSHVFSAIELRKAGASVRADAPARIVSAHAEEVVEVMTSEEAAKLLNVSRTHLNKLVADGSLGQVPRTRGGHRRIPKAAVLQYRQTSKERRAKAIDALMETTGRMGMYEDELEDLPVRCKR